jgi:hypothetical protein
MTTTSINLTSGSARRRRRLVQAPLVAGLGLCAVLLMAKPASAAATEEDVIRNYVADFTDCDQATGPTCLAVHVVGRIQHEEAGKSELNSSTAAVDLFQVQLDPFQVTPIASGSTPVKIKVEGLQSGAFAARVPLDDGTTVKIRLTFTGTGAVDDQTTTGQYPAPLCPTGDATGTLRTRTRAANVKGSVIAHGSAQAVTTSFEAPFIFLGQSEGVCL